ncbi:MAG: VWA domain-containing protein [Myxococcales bacterium]|nr:VWA domain-containing protein [Myxococcales bacterium]
MSAPSPALEDLGRKIERLVLAPETISAPLTRVLRPLLYRIGWRPKASVEAMRALMAQLDWIRRSEGDVAACRKLLSTATDELRDNLQQVERATVIQRRPLLAHAAWLRRLYELLVHAERATAAEGGRGDLHLAATADDALLLPPLAMGKARAELGEGKGDDAEGDDAGGDDAEGDDAEGETKRRADPARVLELQLDTIDHLMAAAREEDALLGRRRRLLDAALQLMLETSAALALDQRGVHQRLQNSALQITRINRYQAAGLRPDVALIHQARSALSRGERDKLFAALSVLRRSAVDQGDLDITALTTRAIDALHRRIPAGDDDRDAGEHSLGRSAVEILGDRVVDAITQGYERGRQRRRRDDDDDETNTDRWVATQVRDYFAPGKERDTLAHAITVDGCFEVGGVLCPVRVEEQFVWHRVVPFPTQDLRLVQATGPKDIATALIHDPRTVILDLAAGRLLSRNYVQEEVGTRTRTLMQGEVRVYLLDGSSSMLGSRARMRDAILVAELATLLRRLENPQEHTRVVLYYRYFNQVLGPVHRVDSPGGVMQAIQEVVSTPRSGGTDIQTALLSSLELIAEAQRDDSELARAQIVLVTDGVANVDEGMISRARQELGDLPVGVSVIALGEENRALRRLVANQRAQGERAFYHFLPDDYLERLSSEELGDDEIHLPPVPSTDLRAFEGELGPLLEELAELQRSRESRALRDLDRLDRERRIERADIEAAGEGQRARLEALYKDDRALQRRYEHWFPRPLTGPGPAPPGALVRAAPQDGTLERDDLDSTLVVLTTIAEVVESVGSNRLGRQADAVELLERLLPDSRLTPGRYHEVLRTYPAQLGPALEAVHGAVHAGLAWRIERGHTYGRDESDSRR